MRYLLLKIVIMRFRLTNRQFHHIIKEEQRNLPAKLKDKVNKATEDFAKEMYGKEHGEENNNIANMYNIPGYKNDADIKGGPFSVGNAKLSPDTLVINFTSAFGCPSATQCPVTQAACYAVAGENRLKDTRSKNVKVHVLLRRAITKKQVPRFFQIAKMYIEGFKDSKKPIKWVRFNEAGDFPTQSVLDAATQFAREIEQEYGVKCMAYTANGRLNYEEASKVMAINASTNLVLDKMSPDATKRNFFAAPHQVINYDFLSDKADAEYEEWKMEHNLRSSKKAEEVPFDVVDKLEINGTTEDITVPLLQWGQWGPADDETGYYYVCPCSFWKDWKDQIEYPYCKKILDRPPYTLRHLASVYKKVKGKNGNLVDHPIVKELKKQLNKVKSPCGVSCAVCHDRKGGIVKGTGEQVKNYAIITATHGSTKGNFSPIYAHLKRIGDPSAKYTEENPNGLWRNAGGVGKYGTKPTRPNTEDNNEE